MAILTEQPPHDSSDKENSNVLLQQNSQPKSKSQTLSINLSKLTKEQLWTRDVFGRNIVHLVILCNRTDLLRQLLKHPDIKLILTKTDYENGWNCLHYTIFLKRLHCYKIILEFLKICNPGNNSLLLTNNSMLFDLIRCKDRTRNTPMQLLDNDFKSLIWIPQYVDTDDEVKFEYRFLDEPKPQISTSSLQDSQALANNEDSDYQLRLKQYKKKIRHLKDHHIWWDPRRCGSEIFMFGSNSNNNLGLGDSTDRTIPSKLSSHYFIEDDTHDILYSARFKSLKLSKNHSVIITKDGYLYSCGIGSRGRLGHGIEDMNNCYRFKKICAFDSDSTSRRKVVKDCAISADHSVVVTTENEVYSWGSNSNCQLGVKQAAGNGSSISKDFSDHFEPIPKLVFLGDIKKASTSIKALAVSKIHSLAYTKYDIISWGLNIGQMGFPPDTLTIEHKFNRQTYKGGLQLLPRKVTLRDEIKLVETCETCTCVVTVSNDIHLYFQNQHVKLPKIPTRGSFDKNFHIFNPIKLTKPASIIKICCKSHENIGFLLESGDIVGISLKDETNLAKYSRTVKYNSIWKSHDQDLRVVDFDMANDGSVVLTTTTGLVFMKYSGNANKIRKNSMSETALPIPIKNKFKRIDYMNKIAKVSCDDNFMSFGFIRDDVDMIPLQIQTNTFIKDLEYLSFLSSSDLYRKQNELFAIEGPKSSYITDFIFPSQQVEEEYDLFESDEEDNLDNSDSDIKLDSWFNKYVGKFDSNSNKRRKTRYTYGQVESDDLELLKETLKTDIRNFDGLNDDKQYDCFFKFNDHPDISIGFHKRLFMVRSSFMTKLINENAEDPVLFIEDNLSGRFMDNEFFFESHVNVKSVLIFTHFIYTNRIISIWDDYPVGAHCPSDIKNIKKDFERLGKLFNVLDMFGTLTKDEYYIRSMRNLLELDSVMGDLTIRLEDGDLKCSSFILTARSAFFETTLASRWNNHMDILEFNKLTVCQFRLILKHIYGFSDYELFEELKTKCDGPNDFIGAILEIIQISDELLLFQLKALCELAIKDLITTETAVVLLVHADDLNAKKLFINCCWYIYNNLELVLLDESLLAIPNEVLMKLEEQIIALDQCKKAQIEDNTNSETNWLKNNSNMLLNQFINNLAKFNENFMSDEKGFLSFEPLIDVKLDLSKGDQPRKHRRSSRKSSTHEINEDIQEVRRAILALTQSMRNSESAIDNDDSDFEVVTTKKKTKKVGFAPERSPSPTTSTPASSSNSSTSELSQIQIPLVRARNGSNGSINQEKSFPVLGKISNSTIKQQKTIESRTNKNSITSTNTPFAGLSPHSNWASKSTGSSLLKTPTLGTSSQPNKVINDAQEFNIKKQKNKIGPNIKVSQKERKRMALSEIRKPTDIKTSFSWGSSGSGSGSSSGVGNTAVSVSDNSGFPTLKAQKSRSPSYKTPPPSSNKVIASVGVVSPNSSMDSGNLSLTDIMLEESLKLEEAKFKDNQRKTLQEIQQEEEFAKWWEEEAAKVQQQMQTFNIKPKPKKKFKKSEKPKTGN